MKSYMVSIALSLIFLACTPSAAENRGDLKYPDNPHYLPRTDYCYFYRIDPEGGSAYEAGWSNTKPEIIHLGENYGIRAINVRVRKSDSGTRDIYMPQIEIWINSVEDKIRIESKCG